MAVEAVLGWLLPTVLFVVAVILFYLYGTWTFNTWKQQGIPGPKPVVLFGTARDISKKGMFGALRDWGKQYGKMYGIYQFRLPALVISDVDMIKEVTIKDFSNFSDRGNRLPFQRPPSNRNLVNVSGDTWRRQRHTLTPTFSAAKLKQMSRFISRCCDNLFKSIVKRAETGEPVDVKKSFGAYTLDVISGTGFGFETNTLEDGDNMFLNAVVKVFATFGRPTLPVVLARMFPVVEPVLMMLGCSNTAAVKEREFINDTIRSLMEDRKKTGTTNVDILQLMLSAEATEEHVKENPNEKCLTTEEILAQGTVLFAAGYETTATTLQYMSYLLAMNPGVQEKLHQEIVKAIGDDEPTYENVSKISYLDSCIYETLRVFPPIPAFGRQAAETRTIKGVTIPAGCNVLVSVATIMQHEDLFPQPEKYMPERYEEGGCSSDVPSIIKELPFGCGPRQCIGMRLALYEAKMAMAALVRKVKFVKIPETTEKITLKLNILSAPDKPIMIGVKLRE